MSVATLGTRCPECGGALADVDALARCPVCRWQEFAAAD